MPESWLAIVQDADGNEETEVVTLSILSDSRGLAGGVIELTDGTRITLVEPAQEAA